MTPRIRFLAFVVIILVVAAVLQTVVLARVGLPGGNPDLLLLAVISVGLATGPNFGALAGFGAGMLADVLPPDLTTLGTTALILAIVGYVAGGIDDPRGLAPAQLLGIIAGLAIFASVLQLLLAWLFADRALDVAPGLGGVLAYTAYTTILGIVLVPLTVRTLRRIGGGQMVRRKPAGDWSQSATRGGGRS